MGVVDLFQSAGDILHHALKRLRHMVEGAVGVDHRVFDQAVGVDAGVEVRHKGLQSKILTATLPEAGANDKADAASVRMRGHTPSRNRHEQCLAKARSTRCHYRRRPCRTDGR
ncbi:hypothetical protein PSEUDO8BK_80277 [Pseudomonas sp. 8BK]|nr:hypothetical protein PSEUDO8BK_80277 [Pseudomonas sp. 8BK]